MNHSKILRKLLMLLKNKTVILCLASAGVITLTGSFILGGLYSFYKDKNKLLKILTGILSYLLFRKNNDLINEILDMLIKIKFIQSISIDKNNRTIFSRQKNANSVSFSYYTRELQYKNKKFGTLNASFIEK